MYSVVLTPSPPPDYGSVRSYLSCHLSTLNKQYIAGAGLPNHMMGEVWGGIQKEEDRRPLSIQSSLIFTFYLFIRLLKSRGLE